MRILAALTADGSASVRDLADALDVSESTIRRDLQTLDQNGELVRTHGGAVFQPRSTIAAAGEPAVLERSWSEGDLVERPIKLAMAKLAASIVADGDVVLLDIGTTTPLIAQELRGRPVTVVTSNMAVLDILRDDDSVRVIMLGGVLRRNYRSLVGSLTQNALNQISADIVFLSCTGVRDNGFVVDDMAVEAPIKYKMIEVSSRIVVLAAGRKFPGTGSLRLCSVADVDVLITSEGASETALNICREAGGEVMIA